MRSLSVRLLLSFLLLVAPIPLLAHSITISTPTTFAALDGSSSDHDGVSNGVFTVSDGDLVVSAAINCSDDVSGTGSGCAMTFAVSGDLVVNGGGGLYAENRTGGGTGGAITLNVGRDLLLSGSGIVSTASQSSSGAMGGAITATVARNVSIGAGSTIDAGSANAQAGNILVSAGGTISVDGNVLSGPSRTILATRLTDAALQGGTSNQVGGSIRFTSTSFTGPAVSVGSNANVISQGETTGAGPVKLEGCGVSVKGLVAALSRKDAPAKLAIQSGKGIVIDARDLGVAGATLGRLARLRADAPTGTAINKGVDLFAAEEIEILGPASASSSSFPITSLAGVHDAKSFGGAIRVTSTGGGVTASGNVIDDGRTASGDSGGAIDIAAKNNINLDTAVIRAFGDSSTNNPARGGGSIKIRSYSGNVVWTNGAGDVRPTGSASGLPAADQGMIEITACGTISLAGSSFPTNGSPVGPWPVTTTGSCSPAAPSLPAGVVLVTCNTPPVANDVNASTNEDNSVTITLSGSDADGDSLTFSIVSGPSNGVLGPIVPTGPTSATVQYTPNTNFNGLDSFVYQANDGNGGTDNATVTITVVPVNDPPSFLAGPTATSLEDAGPQTYPNWATSISAGPPDESGQTITFTVTNDNPSLFSVPPAVSSNGTLTYTAAPNQYGTANITITAKDNGGTANGGNDTSAPQTSSISVTPVNDAPSFTKGANQTVAEDSGAQSVSGWATGISAGPNESSQTVSFVVTNDNHSLFSAQPAVLSSGTLTYTPAADANGTAVVTMFAQDNGGTANGGVDSSAPQTFTITVTAVNDAPSFTGGGNVTALEDSAPYSAAWATAISAGPPDEGGQTVSFNATNDNNALFSVQPAVASNGMLTFTVAANAYGSATVTVTATDDGVPPASSAPQTFTITVTPVNDAPSFTAGGNVTANEDDPPYSAPWASGISAGPNESGQTVAFAVSTDNTALFSAQPAISPSGVLTFTLAANANGVANVTVVLTDDGGTANGGVDSSAPQSFTITVNAVNDPPTFTKGPDVSVLEDSGPASYPAWATGISAGPPDESGQTVSFIVTPANASLFSSLPVVNSNGDLSFTPAPDAFGSTSVTITAQDSAGGMSASQTFTITIVGVNDAPSFTPGGNVTVAEDSGAYSAAWASSISPGPNEGGQTVSFNVSNDNNALFSSQPAISPAGVLMFMPALNASGSATVSVSLSDNGGTANGGVDTSATVTFTIIVMPVNDPPNASADAYDTIGNTLLQVAASQTVSAPAVFVTGSVLSNDTDIDSPPGSLTATLNPGSVTAGAVVTMNSDGTFTYLPPAGHPAATNSFTYTVSDGMASSTGTVTITLKGRVWYVDNTAGAGSGRSNDPFNALASAQSASVASDTIWVYNGNNTVLNQNSGFVLKNGQRLLGQGVALTVPVSVNGGPNPTVLLGAGSKAKISNAGGSGVTGSGVSNVTIAGLDVSGALNSGISLTNASTVTISTMTLSGNLDFGIAGTTVSGLTLSDSSLTGNGDNAVLDEAAFSITNLTGSAAVTNTTFASSVKDNVRILNNTGVLNRVTFTNCTFGTVHASTGNDSVYIEAGGTSTLNASFNACTFTAARGDLLQFNAPGNSTADLVITNSAFSNNHPSILAGGGGVAISGGGGTNPNVTFDIAGNTFRDARGGAIFVNKGSGAGTFAGKINANTIGVSGVANSGSSEASAIDVNLIGGGGVTVAITNNQIYQYNLHGIFMTAGNSLSGGNGTLNATVTGNTVAQPNSGFQVQNGVHLNAGVTSLGPDAHNVCLSLTGNTLGGSGKNGGTDFRLRQRFSTTVKLPGYAGANNDNAAVVAFVQANSTGSETGQAQNNVAGGGGGFVGGAACPTP